MKKCPKCGTILDDSKKKCYMCGTELAKTSANFAESFNIKVGAQTTKGQDNVFNNGKNFNARSSDMIGKGNNGVFFSNNSNSRGLFNGSPNQGYNPDLKAVPLLQPENQVNKKKTNTSIDPVFASFLEKKETKKTKVGEALDKKEAGKKGATNNQPVQPVVKQPAVQQPVQQPVQPKINTPINVQQNQQPTPVIPVPSPAAPIKAAPNPVKEKKVKEPKEKKRILPSFDNGDTDYKINFNMIFNALSFVVFLGLLIFGYFRFVKPKNDEREVLIGKLSYVMDKNMPMKQDEKYSKYYSRGEACAIKVSYGETTDVDGFIDNYFDQIREQYAADENHFTKSEEYKINDNSWSGLSVLEMVENPAAAGDFSTITKYKYISIVRDGNYYNIVFANTSNDGECSAIYENFIKTLDFKK